MSDFGRKIVFLFIAIFVIGFAAGATLRTVGLTPFDQSLDMGIIACTEEAKLCPDGSYVGRVGPLCEFETCPDVNNGGGEGDAIYCTMDAMECPDGSYVVRGGPNCEFDACPGGGSGGQEAYSECTTNADCPSGTRCVDASPVVREGTQNLRCWPDGAPMPICLSGLTMIDTPEGERAVKDLKKGDLVWTLNKDMERVAVEILVAGKTSAPENHKVMHIILSDGRELLASPKHPLGDGREVGNIKKGDSIDGVSVTEAKLISYTENFTYDILPEGETGMYFGNGILLQSTLAK